MNKIYENEQLFAATNEELVKATKNIASSALPHDYVMQLYCECMNKACTDRVSVALADYTSQKTELTFFVLPTHYLPEYERPISKTADYWIIKKLPEKLDKEFTV